MFYVASRGLTNPPMILHRPDPRDRPSDPSVVHIDPVLRARILDTVELMDRRGYGVPLEQFARLLYGGSAPAEAVAAEISRMPQFTVRQGLVVRRDRAGQEGAMAARQAGHALHAPEAAALASDFASRLVSSCSLVRSVSLTGSMASSGFDPRDDIDVNIVAKAGAKYTVYLWSLALSAVTSLRNRNKSTDEMGALPFLPKIICVNVVWEESQVRPLARQDKWIAYELLMHQPILGGAFWQGVLDDNPWIAEHFPQVIEPGFVGPDDRAAAAAARAARPGRSFFDFLGRHPHVQRAVERLAQVAVIALHRVVSITRTRSPIAREREAFVNLVKRPYSVYDIPGRERPVPTAALEPR